MLLTASEICVEVVRNAFSCANLSRANSAIIINDWFLIIIDNNTAVEIGIITQLNELLVGQLRSSRLTRHLALCNVLSDLSDV